MATAMLTRPTRGRLGRIITGDAREELKQFDAGAIQTCITSPPYWGLRDYGIKGQIGSRTTTLQNI